MEEDDVFEEVNEELLEQINTAFLVTFLDLLMVTLVRDILFNLSMKEYVIRIWNLKRVSGGILNRKQHH